LTDFDTFWATYPRRVGKHAARQAFAKRPTEATLDKLLAALDWQKRQPQWQTERYIPHPSTWLHQQRWEDEPFETPNLTSQAWDRLLTRRLSDELKPS
jgi:hypothetical protein